MKNYGLFIRANYRDGLTLGHVVDGLVGCLLIKEVPEDYTVPEIETLVLCQALGFKFGKNLHENVLLPEIDFPVISRFNAEVSFLAVVSGAVRELTKQRLARQAA